MNLKQHFTFLSPLLLCLLMGLSSPLQAQETTSLTQQLENDEQSALEALSLYPDSLRTVILEACKYPEIIVRLESMQSRSSASFQDLLSPLDQTTQEGIWDLTRYPGLVEDLVEGGKKSQAEIREILVTYPEAAHENALQYGRSEYRVLAGIHQLNESSALAFEEVLAAYPPAVKSTFLTLLTLPEVMGILTDNMRMTILVGDQYQRDPAGVKREMDAINVEVANQNAKELEAWKQTLEDNPEALQELEAASEEYAQTYSQPTRVVQTQVVYQTVWTGPYWYAYPYWYGYPWWYDYPHWYPYPYWYDWGYYYGPGGSIVIIGLPSWHFCHWYFHRPRNHYRYYHLSDCFVTYHHHHRSSFSGMGRAVASWEAEKKDMLPQGWMEPEGRADRFRELGKFEMDYAEANLRKPGETISKEAYLAKNTKKYPSLAPAVAPATTGKAVSTSQPDRTPVLPQPKTPPSKEPVVQPNWQKPTISVEPSRTPKRTPLPKARDYHDNTWRKVQPATTTPKVRPQNTTPRTISTGKTPKMTPKRK